MQQPQPTTTEPSRLYEFLAWLELNKKRVVAAGVAGLLAIVAAYIYSWNRAQTELEASSALLRLRVSPEAGEGGTAASSTDFLKVANQFPSTAAAERAILLAAGNLFSAGKYPEAQAEFDRFIARHGRSQLAPIAALGVAASLDAQDKLEAAATAYQNVATRYPEDAVVGQAKLAAAAIYETQNQLDTAMRLYDEVAKPAAFGGAAMQAMMRKQRLLEKHPELEKTNAPALAIPPVIEATNLDLTPPDGAPQAR